MGKLYPNGYAKYPIADLCVSHELIPASKSVFLYVNILEQENQSQMVIQANHSWLQYIQYIADLFLLTTHPTAPNAFTVLLSPDHY